MNVPSRSTDRLIVFDLGRVLVRICDGWDHACEVARLPVKLGLGDEARRAALFEPICAMETGRIDTAEFCRQAARVLRVGSNHIQSILDVFVIEAFPGATQLLDELHQRNYELACLSNTQTEHWRQMFDPTNCAGLPMHRFKHHFASHLLGLRKPEDEIYAHVESVTEKRGEQVIFFDDTAENVLGAQRRGWQAHQILRSPDPIAQVREHLREHGIL